MRLAKLTATACLAAVVTGCAAQRAEDDVVVTATRASKESAANEAGAPPPPPPPPPMVSAVPVAPMPSLARAAPDYYVPPVMVAPDPGNERYDGK